MERESGDALNFDPPQASDLSSDFCTGGTTGLPKIAMRTHFSEVFDAWAMQVYTHGASTSAGTVFWAVPLP